MCCIKNKYVLHQSSVHCYLYLVMLHISAKYKRSVNYDLLEVKDSKFGYRVAHYTHDSSSRNMKCCIQL